MTSLSYSAIEDEQEKTKEIQRKINQRKNMNQTQSVHRPSSKNKTQKKRSKKVNSMLDYIHKNEESNQQPTPLEESFDMLKPELQSRQDDENSTDTDSISENNQEGFQNDNRPLLDDSQSPDSIKFQNPERYKQLVQEYGSDMLKPWASEDGPANKSVEQIQQQLNQPQYSEHQQSYQMNTSDNELMRRMNYMIHLLEEQKDEKTDNVNEELILYLFLGIFVIFVTDSFTRVGKYRR